MTATTPISVQFHNTTLLLVEHAGEPFVPMKPIVEGMGLDWKAQHAKLTSNPRFTKGMVEIAIPFDGGPQQTCCMPLRKLPGWMTSIHPNKVRPEIRETVIAYQSECDDALWRYWTEGHAQPVLTHQPAPALPPPSEPPFCTGCAARDWWNAPAIVDKTRHTLRDGPLTWAELDLI